MLTKLPRISHRFIAQDLTQAVGSVTIVRLNSVSSLCQQQIIGVDVAGSAVFGIPRFPYKMTGLGLSFTPPNF